MAEIYKAGSADFALLTDLWEKSVRATHHFITELQIAEIRREVSDGYLPALDVYAYRDDKGETCGFIGLDERKIEMLFISPDKRGHGVGRALLRYAIENFAADQLDVNEQNAQAVGFYLKMGFRIVGRSDTDNGGRPLPLLHMRLRAE